MAAFTSKATGNWSASGQTTWNEAGIPGAGDTVTTGSSHTITVDVDTTFAGGTFNGPLIIAAGKKLTHTGNVIQDNVALTFNASSEIISNTAGGNLTWMFKRAASIVKATAGGVRAKWSKTGANRMTTIGEGGFFDNMTYDVDYMDWEGLSSADGTTSICGRFTGTRHMRMLHCRFTSCGSIFGESQNFDAGTAFDYRFEDFEFITPTGSSEVTFLAATGGTGGAGTRRIKGGAFSKIPSGSIAGFEIDSVVFDAGPLTTIWKNKKCINSLVVENSNAQTMTSSFDEMTDVYMLADHVDPADRVNGTTGLGNPHVLGYGFSGAPVFTRIIIDYPHAWLIDNGDGIYGDDSGTFSNGTIQYCLVLPSAKDGRSSANLHGIAHLDSGVKLYHNTVTGKWPQLVFNERTPPDGHVTEMKSNLVVGVSTAVGEFAGAVDDLFWTPPNTSGSADLVTPAGIKNNWVHNGIPFTCSATGLTHNGFRCRLSSVPDGTNVLNGASPNFVDSTRNIITWGVSKGLYAAADFTVNATRRSALDTVRAYLAANPYQIAEMIAWTLNGFAPTNTLFDPTGAFPAHDGGTRGAVSFASGGGGGGGGGGDAWVPTSQTIVAGRHGAVSIGYYLDAPPPVPPPPSTDFGPHPRNLLTSSVIATMDAKIAGGHPDYTGMKATLDQIMNDNPYFGIVTALASGITSTASTIIVTDGSVLPTANFYIRIDLEHIYVQTRSGNTLSGCVRGEAFLFYWPTYNTAHAAGAEVWKSHNDTSGLSSTLSSTINSSVTTFSVASGASFDTSGYCRIGGERMTYTRSGNDFTVARGVNYTTAAAHNAGDTVYKDHGGQAPASGWPPMAGACALLRYRGVAAYTAVKARGMMNMNAVLMASKYVTRPLYVHQDYFRWWGPWVGLCYDWLYSDLSANEKAYYAAWMGEAVIEHQWPTAAQSITGGNPKEWYQKEVVAPVAPDGGLNALQCAITSNAASGAISTSMIMAAASYGDNALAAGQWTKAMTKVDDWLFSAMTTGPAKDGVFIEGTQYMGESYDFCVLVPLLIKSAIGSSAYQSGVNAWAARCTDYLINVTIPGSSSSATFTTSSMTIGSTTLTIASASGWAVGDSLRVYNIHGGIQDVGDVYESVVMGIAGTTFTMRDPALSTFTNKDTFHISRHFPSGDCNQDERDGLKDGFVGAEIACAAYIFMDLLKTANPTYASYLRYWIDNKLKTSNQPNEKVRKFMHDDTTVTPVDYSALPIMWGSTSPSSTGVAFGRSDWTKTGTMVQFLVGGNNFDHVHSHANAYQIRRKGVMLSGEVVGYGGDPDHLGNFRGDYKYFGAKFHNTILMNGHGSINNLNVNPEYSPLPVYIERADKNTGAGYLYCRGNASPGYAMTYRNGWVDWGYANNYASGFWRDFLYIPAADLIVFGDRATYSTGTTSATKWIAQFIGNPTITGQRIDCNYAGQEIVQDVVLPASATLTEIDQLASVDFTELLDYSTYSYADYYPIPSARVETVSGVSATTEYGFQVIQLGDLGFTRKSVTSLTTTNANVAQIGTTHVVGFVRGATPTLNISYVVSGTPRNILMGFAASTAYHVTRAANTITIAAATGSGDTTSTAAGVLDFTL